jgi:hypothetical protein
MKIIHPIPAQRNEPQTVVGKFAKIQHRNESDKIQKISLLNRDFRFASL